MHTAKYIPTILHQKKPHLIQAPSIIPHFIETPSTQLGPAPAQPGQVQIKHSQHSKLHDWNCGEKEGKEPWGDTNPSCSHNPHLSHTTSFPYGWNNLRNNQRLGGAEQALHSSFLVHWAKETLIITSSGHSSITSQGLFPVFTSAWQALHTSAMCWRGKSSHKSAFLFLESFYLYPISWGKPHPV